MTFSETERPVDDDGVPRGPKVRVSGREFVSVKQCSQILKVAAIRVRRYCRNRAYGFSYIEDAWFDEHGERRVTPTQDEI